MKYFVIKTDNYLTVFTVLLKNIKELELSCCHDNNFEKPVRKMKNDILVWWLGWQRGFCIHVFLVKYRKLRNISPGLI